MRSKQKGFEYEQIEGALQESNAITGIILGRHPTQRMTLLWVGCQQESEGAYRINPNGERLHTAENFRLRHSGQCTHLLRFVTEWCNFLATTCKVRTSWL